MSLFSENEAYPGGPLIIETILSNVLLNFVSIEDVINIKPKSGNTCFEFNNFRFDAEVNLPGFCGTIKTAKLKLANTASPNNLGIPLNYQSRDLHPSDLFGLLIPATCDPPIANPCATYGNPPYPVPCNCLDFIITLEFEPCDQNPNCPNLFAHKTIKICCKCDSRLGGTEN